MRPNTASIAEIVSAAVFPVSRAASVTRDLRSCKTSTGPVHLQMMRSPSQKEFDPASGRMLGNFPQAYSHVGLINCALGLSRQTGPAEERASTGSTKAAAEYIRTTTA